MIDYGEGKKMHRKNIGTNTKNTKHKKAEKKSSKNEKKTFAPTMRSPVSGALRKKTGRERQNSKKGQWRLRIKYSGFQEYENGYEAGKSPQEPLEHPKACHPKKKKTTKEPRQNASHVIHIV